MGLRERKRLRTRAVILDAACRLFDEQGYEATTLAQIAAGADIAPRTLFSYFPNKESLLFPESEDRIRAAVATVTAREEGSDPVDVLLLALDAPLEESDDMTSRLATVRTRLAREEPAVGMLGARFQHRAVRELGRALAQEYPQLGLVAASALAGAFVGAAGGAVSAALEQPAGPREQEDRADIRSAVAAALAAFTART